MVFFFAYNISTITTTITNRDGWMSASGLGKVVHDCFVSLCLLLLVQYVRGL